MKAPRLSPQVEYLRSFFHNRRSRTISGTLTASLALSIVIISVVGVAIGLQLQQRHVMAHLEDEANRRLTMLVQTLEMPLWNFDYEHVEDISNSLMSGVLVKKIAVYDATGTLLSTSSEVIDAKSVTRDSKIFHDGEEIGYVEITLASDYPAGFIQQFFLLPTSILLLINLGIVVVIILILLPKVLAKPLRQISSIAGAYGAGNYASLAPGETYREFEAVVAVLAEMAADNSQHVKNLEAEIASRKLAEERIVRLNSVLSTIRDINQLITHEKDVQSLIQESCNILGRGNGYSKAWILLLDEERNFVAAASSGSSDISDFVSRLRAGNYPVCVGELLSQHEPVAIYGQPDKDHEGGISAVEGQGEGVICGRLEHGGKVYGVLGSLFPIRVHIDDEERSLFLELVGDVSFALFSIETEREIEEAHRRHETVLRSSWDGFVMTDNQGNIIEVNEAYCAMVGYSLEELSSMSIQDVEAVESRDEIMTRLQQIQKTGHGRFETKHRRKDGSIVEVEVSVNYVAEEDLFFSFARDVTQRNLKAQELLQSEERFRKIFQFAPDAYVITDLSGRFVLVNSAMEKLSGYSVSELTGRNIFELGVILQDEIPRVTQAMERSALGIFGPAEFTVVKKGGVTAEVESTSFPLELSGETVVLSVVRDVTDRRRSERFLAQAEETFRLLAESSPIGIYIVQQGKFVYTNPQFQKDTGYAAEELLGRESLSLVAPEYRSLVREKAVKMLKGESALPYEYKLVTKGGDVRWSSEMLVSVDYRGERSAVGTYQDITERKKAEESLTRLNQAVEASGEAIFMTDREGIITYINPEFTSLYGYQRDEVVGKVTPRILKSGTLAPEVYVNFWNTLLNGQTVSGELVNKTKDGRLVTIDGSASPVANDEGELVGFLAVQRDITESKKMQEHLMVNDRLAALGQLVSGVAHELNNPLTGVIGFSSLLARRTDLPEDAKEAIDIVNREAMRTANIVKNLLTFARKQPKDKQPTDVNEAIRSVLDLRAYEQRVSNIIVNTDLAPDLPNVYGNAFDLQQVFLNIIINAEQAMLGAHGEGNLTITTARHGDIIRATVSDDGPGIPPENLKRIFDPFFTTKEVGKGTGLGLSICHGIITEHNGKIYAESQLGRGATLVVELSIHNTEREKG